MKVFICWSGTRSKKCAEIFTDWLPKVIQAIEPWMSTDIEKGSRWTPEISNSLENSRIGIVCLTRENLKNEWILFEAGALSKIAETKVCTFLLGLTPTDVEPPLSQFNHTVFERNDIYKMLLTINSQVEKNGERSIDENLLKSVFNMFWPVLDEKIKNIEPEKDTSPIRSDREILEEILSLVRSDINSIQLVKYQLPIAEDEAIKSYNSMVINSGIPPESAIRKVMARLILKYDLSQEMAGIVAARLYCHSFEFINKK